ncbi:MAG: HYR-like domain-containing protein, partial [Limisphaerales bacterium]
ADATYSCAGVVPAANDTLVSATDGCGSGNVAITHGVDLITSSNCVNRFSISRSYTATDACGNSSSRTQTITVNATATPTIATFPADATYSCASAVPVVDDTLVSATDGCGSSSIVISHSADVITSSNCVNRFTISRTYTAIDACGNSASKTQTITVNGATPPIITAFPSDVTFACADSVTSANDELIEAVDNCGTASTTTVTHDSDVVVSRICANNFIIARTYHVTDACGNATSKTQTITVQDNIAPEISCPPGFTVSIFDDIPGPNTEIVTATDNCGVPLKSFVGESSVTNNNIVTITRTFAATDDCGNSSTCSQIITMNPYLATPTANPDSYATLENQTLNVAAPGVLANDTDPNHLPLQTVLVTGPTNGVLKLNADGSFQYVPNTFFAGDDSFVYQASNGGMISTPVSVVLTVTFVNQPPSFTSGANQVVNNYDATQTRSGWASNISPGPSNESSQSVHFNVSNDNNSIFSIQPAISANGTLTYAPAAGRYGTAIVSVVLQDNGGTANGGNNTSSTQKFSIIVNNPPSVAITAPTNTSLFLYPSPVDVVARAVDMDGTVTGVTFFNGTNVIGQGMSAGNNAFTLTWTNAPASNSVLYALATDNYGATNLSAPINIQLGNPVAVTGGQIGFSPSLYSWGQKLSVTNPTISIVQCVTITFTKLEPPGTSVLGVTGTNALGQPYIMFNNTIPPVTGINNYATLLFIAPTQPDVTFTTSASLSQGPAFTVTATDVVPLTRHQFLNDGSFLINFLSVSNRTYYVQYTSDLTTWVTSPIALHGNGTQMQWIDIGPNTTESKPQSVPYRSYRVVAP